MLKKILLIALAASSAALMTEPASAATNPGSGGFYVGIGGTRDTADFNNKLTANLTNSSINANYSGTGFGGNVFAGYGYTFCNGFYLGGEVFGALSSLENKNTLTDDGQSVNEKYDLKNSYGISVLPGYAITNNTLGYVRIGYVRGKFEHSVSSTATDSGNANLNGMQYGVGLQTTLMPSLSLRAEYTYTNYQSYNRTASVNGTQIASASFKPKTDQFGLALAYSFG